MTAAHRNHGKLSNCFSKQLKIAIGKQINDIKFVVAYTIKKTCFLRSKDILGRGTIIV